MEPQIRFCTSVDGTRLSYTTYGRLDGVPVLMVSGWPFSQELAWQTPVVRRFWEGIAAGRGVIGWDRRGTGRSERQLRGLSSELEIADIEAVVEAAGLTTFDVFAYDCIPAIPYAASHPQRVRRLVLYGATLAPRPYERAIAMARTDWQMARRAIATVLYPDGPAELQKLWSTAVRDYVPQDVHMAYMEHDASLDLHDVVTNIRGPTLIITGRDALESAESDEAALLLPDVSMVRLSGKLHWYLDPDALLAPVLDFLGRPDGGGEVAAGATSAMESGTAVILLTDIADSTALTERLGDAVFRDATRALDEQLRSAVRNAGGTPVEGRLLGDGLMATFVSAKQAIEAARRCQELSGESELRLRIGLHAGDVIREGDNVYGGAVNIAARIADASAAGETLVSSTVRDLARTSAGVSFEDRGERELKGVSEPVRVFGILWQERD
jgi:class 3 adenylate cyclase